jgi:hypothetical protein
MSESKTIHVRNESGQVAHFTVDGPNDPRAHVLAQRIARQELEAVSASTKSSRPGEGGLLLDAHVGVKDERGDFLKSVHGGGLDPDAEGDVGGDPSGSKEIKGRVEADTSSVSEAAISQAEAPPASEPAKKAAKKLDK